MIGLPSDIEYLNNYHQALFMQDDDVKKLFYVYFTLYFGETISIVHPFKSFEVAKRATLQFIKEEAVERMKELTYITNFVNE